MTDGANRNDRAMREADNHQTVTSVEQNFTSKGIPVTQEWQKIAQRMQAEKNLGELLDLADKLIDELDGNQRQDPHATATPKQSVEPNPSGRR